MFNIIFGKEKPTYTKKAKWLRVLAIVLALNTFGFILRMPLSLEGITRHLWLFLGVVISGGMFYYSMKLLATELKTTNS
ncbi:MAG: hypothetical protein LBV67_02580 [Streptococcaceae bacterium]|nr:hypothetical protein [Streptococcaceae bacterium]